MDLFEEDLSLYVTECDGQDVSEFNFPAPKLMRDQSQGPNPQASWSSRIALADSTNSVQSADCLSDGVRW